MCAWRHNRIEEQQLTLFADYYVHDGEELIGAKQNRVANLTMLIPAAKTTNIPVSCVEAGRCLTAGRTSGSATAFRIRAGAEKLQDVRESLRTSGIPRSDQGHVWSSIDDAAEELEASSGHHSHECDLRAPRRHAQ